MASSALEEPNGTSLRDRSKGDERTETSTVIKEVEVAESIDNEDASKPRKTFGRTLGGEGGFPFPLLGINFFN